MVHSIRGVLRLQVLEMASALRQTGARREPEDVQRRIIQSQYEILNSGLSAGRKRALDEWMHRFGLILCAGFSRKADTCVLIDICLQTTNSWTADGRGGRAWKCRLPAVCCSSSGTGGDESTWRGLSTPSCSSSSSFSSSSYPSTTASYSSYPPSCHAPPSAHRKLSTASIATPRRPHSFPPVAVPRPINLRHLPLHRPDKVPLYLLLRHPHAPVVSSQGTRKMGTGKRPGDQGTHGQCRRNDLRT